MENRIVAQALSNPITQNIITGRCHVMHSVGQSDADIVLRKGYRGCEHHRILFFLHGSTHFWILRHPPVLCRLAVMYRLCIDACIVQADLYKLYIDDNQVAVCRTLKGERRRYKKRQSQYHHQNTHATVGLDQKTPEWMTYVQKQHCPAFVAEKRYCYATFRDDGKKKELRKTQVQVFVRQSAVNSLCGVKTPTFTSFTFAPFSCHLPHGWMNG